MIDVELVGHQPPKALHIPIEEEGHTMWQTYTLVSTEGFSPFAAYARDGEVMRSTP